LGAQGAWYTRRARQTLDAWQARARHARTGAAGRISCQVLAHGLYTSPLPRPDVDADAESDEDIDEYIAAHLRAAREEARRIPAGTGERRPVRVGGVTRHLAREQIEHRLRRTCPHSLNYMYHRLHEDMVDVRDFEAACDHFGLRGVLEDITYGQMTEEMRARKERGAAPSTGMLPMFLDEIMPREMADARVAIVERRLDEARAKVRVAPAA